MTYTIEYTKNLYKFTKSGAFKGGSKLTNVEVDAGDEDEARELFAKHYPGCKIIYITEEPKII